MKWTIKPRGIALGGRFLNSAGILFGAMAGLGGSTAFAACTAALSITETKQMAFGTIGVTAGGGTVTLKTGGTVTAPSGFFLSGTPAAGTFKVSAGASAANCAVIISLTSGSLTGPGAAMTLGNFTNNAGASPKLNSTGNLTFKVGADLIVNAAEKAGAYSGTYGVTVIY